MSSDVAANNANLADASNALRDKRVGDGGMFGWTNRPLDNTGKQVEDGDRVTLRCALPRHQGWGERLLPGAWGKGAVTFDIDGSKNLFIILYPNEGGQWAKLQHYETADLADKYVVRKSPEGNVNLYQLMHDDTIKNLLANQGHWINTYDGYFNEKACSVGVNAQGGGYELHFAPSDREATAGDYVNVKNEGKYFRVFFYNEGKLGDGRPQRLEKQRMENMFRMG